MKYKLHHAFQDSSQWQAIINNCRSFRVIASEACSKSLSHPRVTVSGHKGRFFFNNQITRKNIHSTFGDKIFIGVIWIQFFFIHNWFLGWVLGCGGGGVGCGGVRWGWGRLLGNLQSMRWWIVWDMHDDMCPGNWQFSAHCPWCLWNSSCISWQIDSSPPRAIYMRLWTGSALIQVMAFRMFRAKPLPDPIMPCYQFDP